MEQLFSLLIVVTVVVTVFSLGLVLTLRAVVDAVRSGRILILALVANVVVVPCLSWAIAAVLPLSPAEATGVVLVAVGAGGSLAIKAVQISGRGDLALALSLVVLLELTDVVTVPSWLRILASGDTAVTTAPLRSVALTVLAPMLLGVVVARLWPGRAHRWAAVLGVVSTAGLLAAVTTGVLAYRKDLVQDLWSWVAVCGALIGLLAVGAGWVAGHYAHPRQGPVRRADLDGGATVAMVTASRFSSLGLLIVDQVFPADSGAHSPAIVTALVLLGISLAYAVLLRLYRTGGARVPGLSRTTGGPSASQVS